MATRDGGGWQIRDSSLHLFFALAVKELQAVPFLVRFEPPLLLTSLSMLAESTGSTYHETINQSRHLIRFLPSLLCDPGSQLRLGGRAKRRTKVIP